ncbi:MAG: hypothetical protein K6C99_09965 [Lachnospiraceae bacterium]|nr:hypothetical protein [Lachnospiraceae bacterium]
MPIGMVEMQGSIPRVQDFQNYQQFENDKGIIYQAQHQVQVDKNVDQENHQVHTKEDANAETETDERERESGYAGDGGRDRRRKNTGEQASPDRLIVKSKGGFDIKI